ncbi:hypothetical protein PENTCL1PPCAC_16593, partial [Pristionchus entomophagus]
LAFNGKIVYRMRCNNSQWMVDGEVAEPVVCALSYQSTKTCPMLQNNPWEPAQCKTSWDTCGQAYKCMDPTLTTTAYTCASGGQPIMAKNSKIKLDSITCDRTKGEWVYTVGGIKMTEQQIAVTIGTGPPQYSCLIPDGPSKLQCGPLSNNWYVPDCNTKLASEGYLCDYVAEKIDCDVICASGAPALQYYDSATQTNPHVIFELNGVTCTATGWMFKYKKGGVVVTEDKATFIAGHAPVASQWGWACATATAG